MVASEFKSDQTLASQTLIHFYFLDSCPSVNVCIVCDLDSWGSTGSREETFLQTDPTTWIKKDFHKETSDRSPVGSEDVSSSLTEEQSNGCPNGIQSPQSAPKNPNTANSKAKARTAFSESQMSILVHKFSVQRYLPPAEMKNLAEVTGLTYKQVRGSPKNIVCCGLQTAHL